MAGSLSHADRVVAERVAGVRAVEVDAGMGDVVVTADPAAEDISLRQTQRWWLGTPRFSARRAGDVLEIRSSCPATPGLPCSGTLELVVPPGTAIDVRTDDAPVRLDGLAGTVVVRSGDGAIAAGGLRGADVDLRAGDASIHATFATAPAQIRATAADGAIEIRVPRDGGAWRVDGSTGDAERRVEIAVDPAAPRTVVVTTGDGAVRVGYDG